MRKQRSHIRAIGVLVLLTGAIGIGSLKQAHAWTNPGGAPPYATPSIITSGGNVGVGTAAPAYKLDVNGDINLTGTLRQNGAVFSTGLGGSGTAGYVPKWTAGSTLGNSTIYDNGNIGIGTANPTAYLAGTNGAAIYGTNPGLAFSTPSKTWLFYGFNLDSSFRIFENSASLDRLTILPGGNVGIGTAAPAYKLDVNGSGNFANTLAVTGSGDTTYNVNGWQAMGRYAGWDANTLYMNGYGGFANGVSIGSPGAPGSKFQVYGGTSYFGGNVGIGTATPGDKLEINGNLRFTTANPYINASSYFIAPGGAYFNGGIVYAESPIQARGGLHNDTGPYLALQGGTTGKTLLSGALRFPDGTEQATAGGSTQLTTSAFIRAGDFFTGALSPGCVQYNNGGIYYVCTNIATVSIPAGRNNICYLTTNEFEDTYGPTFGVKDTLQHPSCQVFSNGQVNASLTFYGTTPDRYDYVNCVMTCTIF